MENKYSEEAKEKFGREIVNDSEDRVASWSPAYKKAIFDEGETITAALAKLMKKDTGDDEVQALIAKHHGHICRFYDCTFRQYRGMGEMYVADPRFTAYYDKYAVGLAQFMKNAIAFYCDINETKYKR